jgi:hypothetical protein
LKKEGPLCVPGAHPEERDFCQNVPAGDRIVLLPVHQNTTPGGRNVMVELFVVGAIVIVAVFMYNSLVRLRETATGRGRTSMSN